MLNLYLIRHGESEKNLNPNLIGGRDFHSPLSTKGIEQSLLLGKRFENEGICFDKVYCSTAVRAVSTAKIACESIYSIENIVFTDSLLELSQGDWEGKSRSEILTYDMMKKIDENRWEFKAPNGESLKDVEERMMAWAYKELTPKARNDDITIGLFGHGIANKCLLREIMGFNPNMIWQIKLDNTSITKLKYDSQKWYVLSINDNAHLK